MRKFIFFIVAALLLASLGLLAYQRSGRPTTLEGLYDEYHLRGLRMQIQSPFNGVVLVARDGEVVFDRAYGFVDVARSEPLTIDSRFLIGAGAKPITATLVLQQVEAGVLELDGAVADYLPEFPANVTLHQLLSHTGGLPSEAVEFDELVLDDEPGKTYAFSNFGYDLLVSILEASTESSYAELVEAGIVDPLGLSNTGFAAGENLAAEVAIGMRFEEHPYPVALVTTGVGSYDALRPPAAGAFYTSVHDLHRIVQALRGGELLSAAMTVRMFTPNLEGYAYGWARNREWAIERNPAAPLYTHVGRIAGYNTVVGLYDDGTTVIVLSNVEPLGVATVLHDSWLAAHGMTEVETDLKQPSLSSPRAFREAGGAEAFLEYYRALSDRAGYPIDPSPGLCEQVLRLMVRGDQFDEAVAFGDIAAERWVGESSATLNTFGYVFLQRDRFDDARRYFERNVELHPDDANAHDSLGECHERQGALDLARTSYARAVEIARAQDDRMLGFYERRLASVN